MAKRGLMVLAWTAFAAVATVTTARGAGASGGQLGQRDSGESAGTLMQFRCNIGYTPRACADQLFQLQVLLEKFDLHRLGGWMWILVRSEDWRIILRRVGRDPDSPAFTILEKRQTFLEEALFSPMPEPSRTLLQKWRIPLDRLLEYAVTHELGHALCGEADESRVHAYARELRDSATVTCAAADQKPSK
jgi:hypothetical protein